MGNTRPKKLPSLLGLLEPILKFDKCSIPSLVICNQSSGTNLYHSILTHLVNTTVVVSLKDYGIIGRVSTLLFTSCYHICLHIHTTNVDRLNFFANQYGLLLTRLTSPWATHVLAPSKCSYHASDHNYT